MPELVLPQPELREQTVRGRSRPQRQRGRVGDQIWVPPGYTVRVVGTVAGEGAAGFGEFIVEPVKAA